MPIGHNLSAFDALPGTALKWNFRIKVAEGWRFVAMTPFPHERFTDDFSAALAWFLRTFPALRGAPVEITRLAAGPAGKSTLKRVYDEQVAA